MVSIPSKFARENGWFNSRSGRVLLENLTAYLFLAPAGLIIFTFGIFPVAFAFFVSLHRWRRFPDEYQGLDNYVKAIGDLAFVVFFWIAVGLLLFAFYALWKFWRDSKEERRAVALFIPGAALAAGIFAFLNWFFILLPFILDVPRRLRGQAITQSLFVDEFLNSFQFPEVLQAADWMWLTALTAIVLTVVFSRLLNTRRHSKRILQSAAISLALAAGLLILRLTLSELETAITAAREAGESLPIWTQIILISAGAGLLFTGVWLWQKAVTAEDDRRFVLRAGMVICSVVGAVFLIMELPPALSNADRSVLQGFNVTVMYSLFSVPLQLIIGLGLAVLLFQKIKGKTFFRLVYFLPYITPFVATSVVFALLFSHRSGSPANQLLTALGLPAQNWLLEPKGVFEIIFGAGVPSWLVGPGLALVVIILYNVWIYAGYSTVIFLAGLGNIPAELYEAAKIDGANSWSSFRYVTLPLLSPTTFFLMLIATIGTFQAFTQIFLMRRPGAFKAVDTINIYIYEEIRAGNPNYAYGSAMAFVLFAVILALTLIQNRVMGRKVFYG